MAWWSQIIDTMSGILRSKYRTALPLFLSIFQGLAEAVSPVSIKGTKLYDESGAQFFLKGTTCCPFHLALRLT